jgi:hypothetical protein
MNYLRSNKDLRETESTMSRTHRSDRKTEPSPTMMEEGQEG